MAPSSFSSYGGTRRLDMDALRLRFKETKGRELKSPPLFTKREKVW